MIETPELDKMLKVHDDSVIISGFLEWAEANGYELVKNVTGDGPHFEDYQVPVVNEKVLAEFFEIDLVKADEEREALRKAQAAINEKHRATYTVHPAPEETT